MKKSEMGVAVAEDVLKLLRNKRLLAIKGTYLNSSYIREEIPDSDRQVVKKVLSQGECSVCAYGACFLSFIRVFDDVPVDEIVSDDYGHYWKLSAGGTKIEWYLSKVFSKSCLTLIESAFECSDMRDWPYGIVSDNQIDKAIKFGRKYADAKTRLRAIMKNIIENNGVFKPESFTKRKIAV